MLDQRCSGILCPVFSLPNAEGIGTFGKTAYQFIDLLSLTQQRYWQVLPIGGTSVGDSPYQSFSSYAGNPYFIDLQILVNQGLLLQKDIDSVHWGDSSFVNYDILWNQKYALLRKAFSHTDLTDEMYRYAYQDHPWLEDYVTFMALKYHFNGVSRIDWPQHSVKSFLSQELKSQLNSEIHFHIFLQLMFYRQWNELKKYANKQGIAIIGDIPIFVSEDSSDVWANAQYFQLDELGRVNCVSGVPPDYFSEDGQLWGNPLYNWNKLQEDNFMWWIARVKNSFKLFDVLRIDHFCGFESYWSIKAPAENALSGEWVKAPGYDFFDALKKELGEVHIIAEDLGIITDDVKALIKYVKFPGMKVLQFAFDNDLQNPYKPENIKENSVVYTGTHDNDTTVGWFCNPKNKGYVDNALKYMKMDKISAQNFTRKFIEMAFSTKANIVITPIQDWLVLGTKSRINIPSTIEGNWQWRLSSFPDKCMQEWLISITNKYARNCIKK